MAVKTHQRVRRYLPRKRRKPRLTRAKTFLSEETAKKYAEENNIKDYEIVRLRFGLSKKYKIVEK